MVDDAVSTVMNMKKLLEFEYCNNRLKLVLETCKQFCSLKRCVVCYRMDFNNTFHVETYSTIVVPILFAIVIVVSTIR